jgi:hypothetical protein
MQPATEEEKLKFANDEFIGAIKCQKYGRLLDLSSVLTCLLPDRTGCAGFYREVDTAETLAFAKRHQLLQQGKSAAAAAESKADGKSEAKAEGSEAKASDPMQLPEFVFQCSGCKQIATGTQINPLAGLWCFLPVRASLMLLACV